MLANPLFILLYVLGLICIGAAIIAFIALLVSGLRGRGGDTGTLWAVFFIGLIVVVVLFYLRIL